jgi:hypothetical protein
MSASAFPSPEAAILLSANHFRFAPIADGTGQCGDSR